MDETVVSDKGRIAKGRGGGAESVYNIQRILRADTRRVRVVEIESKQNKVKEQYIYIYNVINL